MRQFDNITLCCVDTAYHGGSIAALKKSMAQANFAKVIFCTDRHFNIEGIEIIKISPITSKREYSKFIVYELHKYINTDFALIIQNDGFVINPDKWDDKFLEYDYIGAPFPIPPSHDNISYRDPFGNLIRVGNGGFSLRSKKLLQLPTTLNLEWKAYFGYYNEDGFFAVHNKHVFENNGCKYSPVDLAARFSIEKDTPETIGVTSFGFHGKSNPNNNLI